MFSGGSFLSRQRGRQITVYRDWRSKKHYALTCAIPLALRPAGCLAAGSPDLLLLRSCLAAGSVGSHPTQDASPFGLLMQPTAQPRCCLVPKGLDSANPESPANPVTFPSLRPLNAGAWLAVTNALSPK